MSSANVKYKPHSSDWRQSIMSQLQTRKSIEQSRFEELCEFARNIFEKVDIYKSENIQLNLQREQLQQQLLGIQQTILAGGSVAAKTILSKFPNAGDENSDTSGASLLVEKSQLEKKILELQEKLSDALKSNSDAMQKIVSQKIEIDDKDRFIKQSTLNLEESSREIKKLRESLEILESKYRTMNDEYLALQLSYKSLDKRHHNLKIENDNLKTTILRVKDSDAERLNAENEIIMREQQDRIRRELEANVAAMNQIDLNRQATDDPNALAINADNFEVLDEDISPLNTISRVPENLEFSFEAHEGEVCAVNWYCYNGPRDDYLATGGSDRKVKIWKISEGKSSNVAALLGSNASITSIDIEGEAILASSNDMATRIWGVNDYKLKKALTGHSAKVISAKFLGVSNKVASGSQDRTIKIWDVFKGACYRTYFAGSSCYDLVYNNYQVITGHFDSRIRCWDLRKPNDNESTGQIVLQNKITSLDVSKDGTKLLCSLRDNTIKCLDLRKMEVLQTYSDEKFRIGADSVRAKFSIDGQFIGCGSQDGSLYIWDTSTAKVEKVLSGHNNVILASCWSPNGQRMVTIERGKKTTIWY